MDFIKKAREAAEAAAEGARDVASAAARTAQDPTTAEKVNKSLQGASQGAREAVGLARRGVTTVVERIDPSTLAELVVKATALQEMTNGALRAKGSPYRISEITISASIPPGVSFAIGRIDDPEEAVTGREVASSELMGSGDGGETVIALDGTTLDRETVDEIVSAVAVPVEPS